MPLGKWPNLVVWMCTVLCGGGEGSVEVGASLRPPPPSPSLFFMAVSGALNRSTPSPTILSTHASRACRWLCCQVLLQPTPCRSLSTVLVLRYPCGRGHATLTPQGYERVHRQLSFYLVRCKGDVA